MNKRESRTEKILLKKAPKEQVAPCALLADSCIAGSRGARGAVPAPEHPAGWRSRSGCPGAPRGLRSASSHCFVKLPGKSSLPTVLPLSTTNSPLDELVPCRLGRNLADPEQGGRGWAGSLVLDPGCFPYFQVPLRGGFVLEKGLTGILYNLFLFLFPPFSSFTKC